MLPLPLKNKIIISLKYKLMKTMNLRFLVILLILLVFIPNCSKDNKVEVKFAGDYVITEALVTEAFTVPIQGVGDYPIPVNTPITTAIQTALLSAVDCSSADKSYIELRDDLSIFLSCEGANPLSAGTWSEVSATELKLNLNSTAVPPIGISLTVTDVLKNGTILTGKSSVPMPKAFIAALIAPALLDETALPVYNVKISLKFTQK
jgi:hypothetical protein